MEFSDGSVAPGRYRRTGDNELILRISAYETARKSAIGAKAWRLRRIDDAQHWKVVAKLVG